MPRLTKVCVIISFLTNFLQFLKFSKIDQSVCLSFPQQTRETCTFKVVSTCAVEQRCKSSLNVCETEEICGQKLSVDKTVSHLLE